MTRLVRAAAVSLLVLGIAGCTTRAVPPSGSDPLLRSATGGHLATVGRGNLRTADFEMSSGVTTLVLHSGDIGTALYRITTPAGASQLPTAVLTDDEVVAQLVNSGVTGPSIVDVELSSAVAWTVHLDGGATEARVNMRAGGLATLDFGAGVTRIDATVPNGVEAIRMSGGASEFDVHAPTGLPVRVTMSGGAGSATIDGTAHSGIGGGTVFAPAAWPASGPRLDIDNTAGVSTFVLDRY